MLRYAALLTQFRENTKYVTLKEKELLLTVDMQV